MRLWIAAVLLLAVVEGTRQRFSNYRSPPTDGNLYALLVAGSDGWFNYRHQADVAHAYHVLRNHGVPAENIITMMVDDIANNEQNPYKGKLYNRPHGEDVYQGLKIDYSGGDVNSKNFMNILKGNKEEVKGGNGRVIESTSEDRIFVYFTDHGAVGLISFPSDILTVQDLTQTLEWMYENERYSQLVFYLEACESGSMFEKVLRKDINVYAITAANAHESSWGTYCENDMGLPCLGDLFSVNWMNDSDLEDLDVETLNKQFDIVKKETNKSHVMRYGNLTIAMEPVGWFQGAKRKGRRHTVNLMDDERSKKSVWPAREIELRTLETLRHQYAADIYAQKKINQRIHKIHKDRKWIKSRVHRLVNFSLRDKEARRRMFKERHAVEDTQCVHEMITNFHLMCVNFNRFPDAMKYAYVLNNLCVERKNLDMLLNHLVDACILPNISGMSIVSSEELNQ